MEKLFQPVAQYVLDTSYKVHVRPYHAKGIVKNEVSFQFSNEALPDAGHWRVIGRVSVAGRDDSGALCYEASAAVEQISVAQDLSDAELQSALTLTAGSALLGHLRQAITSVSLQSGYAPLVLPVVDGQQIRAFFGLSSSAGPEVQ